MDGIYYVLSLIAFWIIAHWFVQNDRRGAGEHTIGVLRMPDEITDVVKGTEPTRRAVGEAA